MRSLEAQAERLRNLIVESNFNGPVIDPEGVHHEFVGGDHGQKIDLDKIPDDSEEYEVLVDTTASFIRGEYDWVPDIIVGVANGANRLALDVARKFNGKMLGLVTEKDKNDLDRIRLSEMACRVIIGVQPEFVLVIEDVITTGWSALEPADDIRAMLPRDAQVEVLSIWQRLPVVSQLVASGIPHKTIISEPLTLYTPQECETTGFCAKGWELIPKGG